MRTSLIFSFFSHTEKLLTTKYVDHFQVNPGVCLATEGAGCHAKAAMCVGVRLVKVRTWIGRASSEHGGLRIQRRCQ